MFLIPLIVHKNKLKTFNRKWQNKFFEWIKIIDVFLSINEMIYS